MFLCPGETLVIMANVRNSSTKQIKPKFTLKQVVMYWASGSTKRTEKVLLIGCGDVHKPNTQKRVVFSMQVPANIAPSIGNCQLLSVEYFVTVWHSGDFNSQSQRRWLSCNNLTIYIYMCFLGVFGHQI